MTNWEETVRMHGPACYRTAWRILGHAEDCEDVLQDVFLEAHKLFTAGQVVHWSAFLRRLVTFRSLDRLRSRRALESLDDWTVQDDTPGPERVAMNREDTARLRAMVARLPPRQATVFCLAHFEELSHEEIAATLNVSKNAVAIALHKARLKLQNDIREDRKEQIHE